MAIILSRQGGLMKFVEGNTKKYYNLNSVMVMLKGDTVSFMDGRFYHYTAFSTPSFVSAEAVADQVGIWKAEAQAGSGASAIVVVANYAALPDPTTVSGKFYFAEDSQGTKWLPGGLGGTYYNAGTYYSNGITWKYMDTPYNASLATVNAGVNDVQFLTSFTFTNSDKIVNSFQKNVDDSDDITEGVFQGFISLPRPNDKDFYYAGDGVWYKLPVITGTDGETEFPSGVTLGDAVSATINANTNDLTVPNIETAVVLRLESTGNYSLTGLAPFNPNKAWMLFVVNVGTNNITIPDNSAASLAENRFLLGANKTIQKDEGIIFFYDPISNRWRGGGINI